MRCVPVIQALRTIRPSYCTPYCVIPPRWLSVAFLRQAYQTNKPDTAPKSPLPALATHAATTSKDIHIHLKKQFGRNWGEYIWNSRSFKANIYGIANRALRLLLFLENPNPMLSHPKGCELTCCRGASTRVAW
jgi:hypothetical protein